MIRIYYVPAPTITREYLLIKQGLMSNSRVKLVSCERNSDFVFLFYYRAKHRQHYTQTFPPDKTVLIDYHDSVYWRQNIECLAYFKRSWVEMVGRGNHTIKRPITFPPHFHHLGFAIMDEFLVWDDVVNPVERDVVLSCTLRTHLGRLNRARVLNLVRGMDIKGRTQIGELNKEGARGFGAPLMRDYWKLLRRSRIVVTCNPSKWEGDHRTWEALANGALVFIDRMYTPMVNPLVDGEHCIFYDLSDSGLKELKGKLLWFLEDREGCELTEFIAKAGHDFAMKHHRASNRIDEILEVIT